MNTTSEIEIDSNLDYASLPAILRVLLVTDGMITRILEAWFNEPMLLQHLHQETIRLKKAEPLINADSGDEILRREVSLVGKLSDRPCIHATSLVRLHELDDSLVKELQHGQIGIGELLYERGIETHREILTITDSGLALVQRRYRILIRNRPSILVTERFPLESYRSI